MRASVIAEKVGIPTASICLSGFLKQASATAKGQGISDLRVAEYPGALHLHSDETIRENVARVLKDNVVKSLTQQLPPEHGTISLEKNRPGDIIFEGNLEAVNEFFYRNRWTDGLPVIPPTIDRVKQFLRFTQRSPDDVIGVLLPSQRVATVRNIAINGVMAGCRPEYMPVLLAITECMVDPATALKHKGATPGGEALITINGPVVKELGFNYQQGVLRAGYQANTSIGRFFRLCMINLAGFVLGQSDKATYGDNWKLVLAENDDAVARMGWEPTVIEMDFGENDSIVSLRFVAAMSAAFASTGDKAEEHLARIADMVIQTYQTFMQPVAYGHPNYPQIIISPCVAEVIARGGYSKADMKQYLYDHARMPAWRVEDLIDAEMHMDPKLTLCELVRRGDMPPEFCKSDDPERLVPITYSADNFQITVSGDPERNRNLVCLQNLFGMPVPKKVILPGSWSELLVEAGDRSDRLLLRAGAKANTIQ